MMVENYMVILLAAILFTASWIGGYLIHYRTIQIMSGNNLYGRGSNREITWFEYLARKQTFRREIRPLGFEIQYIDKRPKKMKIFGAFVDTLFFLAVVLLFVELFHANSWGFYFLAGFFSFLYHHLELSEAGKLGYHFNALLYLILWPVLLPYFFWKLRS